MLTTIIQWLTIYILIITIIYSVFPIKEDLIDFKDTDLISKIEEEKIHERNGLSKSLCEDGNFKTKVRLKGKAARPLFASSCPEIRATGNTIHNGLPDIGTYDCVSLPNKDIYKFGSTKNQSLSLKQCADAAQADSNSRAFRYNDATKECILVTGTIDEYTAMDLKYYKNLKNFGTAWKAPKPPMNKTEIDKCFAPAGTNQKGNKDKMTKSEFLCMNKICRKQCETSCGKGKCNDAQLKLKPTNATNAQKASNYTCNIRCKPPQSSIINKSTNHCPKVNRVYLDDTANWSKTGHIYYPKHDSCFKTGKAQNFKQCIEPCYKLSHEQYDTCRRINIDS